MANYYTHFCAILNVGSAVNVGKALKLFEVYRAELENDENEPLFSNFDCVPSKQNPACLILQDDEEGGNPKQAAEFAKRCGAAFGLTGLWGLPYAYTCNAHRPDAFGGGAFTVNLATGEIIDNDATVWLEQQGAAKHEE